MRLERLTYNKIKIFLTFDDLIERGLTKEDLWQDSLKVHQLFRDMIEEASEELGFEANGPVAVEVYSLKAQGMVVIVTTDKENELDEEFNDDYIEMQVTLDESDDILYEFQSIEDVIQLSTRLYCMEIVGGKLFSFENRFFMIFEEEPLIETSDLIALLAEYGNPSTITKYRIYEYGKELMSENAIENIHHFFIKRH
ncbi:genetic competence negative regulator [Bacillus timonensis]|nr:genetic competence negative regulator [Bacillus timonensis]